jgi:hypothetical protein
VSGIAKAATDGQTVRLSPALEVEPSSGPDVQQFKNRGIEWRIYLPSPVLICLSNP